MAIISRSELDHPALGTAGGAGLHTSIEAIYEKLGDNANSRFFTVDALADAATETFDHNFKVALGDLYVYVYQRNTSTGELTKITQATTPALDSFAIAANSSNATTQIDVTNNTGSSQDLAVVVIHGIEPGYLATSWLTSTATTAVAHGLGSAEDIRAISVLENDVTASSYRQIDQSGLVVDWDATNINLAWGTLTPSASLRYQLVVHIGNTVSI